MHTRLIAVGAGLILVGAILLVLALGASGAERTVPAMTEGGPPADRDDTGPSMVLPIAAGLFLAGGAGLIGIGANRWHASGGRPTRRL